MATGAGLGMPEPGFLSEREQVTDLATPKFFICQIKMYFDITFNYNGSSKYLPYNCYMLILEDIMLLFIFAYTGHRTIRTWNCDL